MADPPKNSREFRGGGLKAAWAGNDGFSNVPQVLRDTRYKSSAAGQKMEEGELEDWRFRLARFLSRGPEMASAKTARAKAKAKLSVPRQASYDFLLALEHALQAVLGCGLDKFNVERLLDSPIEGGFVIFPKDGPCAEKGIPPMLVIAADQAGDQCCPFAFLKWGPPKLNFEQIPDRAHLSSNGSLNGCSRAGFHGYIRIAIAIINLRYGSRNSGQIQRLLEDVAADAAANLTSKDEWVRVCWPWVCEDKRWREPDEISDEACDAWLQGLPCSRSVCTKGPQAGSSRWYTWQHGQEYWDGYLVETFFLGVMVALMLKWITHWRDIFGSTRPPLRATLRALKDAVEEDMKKAADASVEAQPPIAHAGAAVAAVLVAPSPDSTPAVPPPNPPPQAEPAPIAGSVQGSIVQAASSSSSASGPTVTPAPPAVPVQGSLAQAASSFSSSSGPGGASKASQEALAKSSAAANRQISANSFHALLRLMARDDVRHATRQINLAAQPFAIDSGEMQKEMKAPVDVARLMAGWAHDSWMGCMKECVLTLSNWTELARCGIILRPSPRPKDESAPQASSQRSAELTIQDKMYEQYYNLVFSLLREHGSNNSHYSIHFPCALAGLLHADVALQQKTMQYFRFHVEAFREAQKYQLPEMQTLLKRHPFHGLAMRFAIKFAEAAQWSLEGHQLRMWLHIMFTSFNSSVMVEKAGKELRDAETRDQCSKVMQYMSAWEVLFESELFKQFGREEIKVGCAGNPPASFNESMFVPKKLPETKLDLAAIKGNPTWWSYSAASIKQVYANMVALDHLALTGDWDKVIYLPCIQYVPERQLVQFPGVEGLVLVLQVFDMAAMCWPVTRESVDRYLFDFSIERLHWHCAFSVDDLKVRWNQIE